MARPALWRDMLLCPAGERAGRSFGLACLINLQGVFAVVVINEDLTTGPGVVGELPQHWQAFLARQRACLACGKNN